MEILTPIASAEPLPPTVDPGAAWNVYHRHCSRSAQDTVLWAVLAGLELLTQQQMLNHGEWIPWVKAHCAYSRRTASEYLGHAAKALQARLGNEADPKTVSKEEIKALKIDVVEMLGTENLKEERAALIAAIKPPKAAPQEAEPAAEPEPEPEPPKPRKPRGPTPLNLKVAPVFVARVRIAPPEVKDALFTDLRPEIEAWLAAHPAA